ncbi:autoinducer binding domain-containing protein [Bradyrhizobium arachidis]|uniref:autoinducer binding domain-containing protein n=1 Tax=Bradyrhizobium arachidis TaxID=858423 RepID=UPI002162D690|nr:autoinducer binding domain-containing protein [Bradyrhizobium arachidis]
MPEYLPAAIPSDWCQRDSVRRYNAIDPVIRRTPTLWGPLWDQLANEYELQAAERRVLDEAREAGLKQVLTVPP